MQRTYTAKDRKFQLEELVLALESFISFLIEYENIEAPRSSYQSCLLETKKMLGGNFTQEQLSMLSRSVPATFWLHKEWMPKLTLNHAGKYVEPEWFSEADKLHSKLMESAGILRIMGTY